MTDYIDRELLKNALYNADAILMRGLAIVNQLPAADVVPVVRCTDCRYNGSCMTQSFVRDEGVMPFEPDEWYCADGARMDGDGDV